MSSHYQNNYDDLKVEPYSFEEEIVSTVYTGKSGLHRNEYVYGYLCLP